MRGAPLLFVGAVSHPVPFFFTVNTLIFSQKLSFVARYYLSFLFSLTFVARISFLFSLFNSLASCFLQIISKCQHYQHVPLCQVLVFVIYLSLLLFPNCNGDLMQCFLYIYPLFSSSLSLLPLDVIQLSLPHPVIHPPRQFTSALVYPSVSLHISDSDSGLCLCQPHVSSTLLLVCLLLTGSFSKYFSFRVSLSSQTSLISFISIFTSPHC